MNISFDFDSTLSEPYIQRLAKKFIEEGNNVFITTSRANKVGGWVVPDGNSDLERIAKKLGIERVIYTGGEDKWLFLPSDTHLHFDDDMNEVELINIHLDAPVAICSRPMNRNLNK